MPTKLLKFGNRVGVLLPEPIARQYGFQAGSFVRIIALEKEVRIRPVWAPVLDDYSPCDEILLREDTGEPYERW